tara:strand:- start:262 stop:975 length:714 start_codon:yes stop_codon:yes gene_type:complete
MNTKVSAFIPLRANSKRIKNKNSKKFDNNGDSLFIFKLKQLTKIEKLFEEIIISTNDKLIINQFNDLNLDKDKYKLIIRDQKLCQSTTKVKDLINHAYQVTKGDIIFWIHVTSPFINEIDYRIALSRYKKILKNKINDSLMSVNKIQQFLWDNENKKIINKEFKSDNWINTQILKPFYEINHAFYINSRRNYLKYKDRIGKKPGLYICEKLKTVDIDWNEDFKYSQKLLSLYSNGFK